MLQCWLYKHKQRPTFQQIIEILVPDLNPSFMEKSYFFSDENHLDDYHDDDYPDDDFPDDEDFLDDSQKRLLNLVRLTSNMATREHNFFDWLKY